MKRFTITMAIVFAVVVGMWAIGAQYGFRVSLIGSLALSIALTVAINLLLSARARNG